MNQFPITQDLILNNKNGWLEIRLNNAVSRNSLKESLVEERKEKRLLLIL